MIWCQFGKPISGTWIPEIRWNELKFIEEKNLAIHPGRTYSGLQKKRIIIQTLQIFTIKLGYSYNWKHALRFLRNIYSIFIKQQMYRPKQDSSAWIFYLSYGWASFAQAKCCYLQSGTLTHLTLITSLKVAIYSKAVIGEAPWLFQIKESNWYLGKCQCETNWLSSSNDYRICFLKYFLKEDWF